MTHLKVEGLNAFYGRSQALRNFAVDVSGGEVLCLLGRNGAGKTTALKSIMGTVKPASGKLILDGKDLFGLPPHDIPRHGIGYVPQGRRLFGELTVWENLEIGLQTRKTGKEALDYALELFPVLKERMDQRSGTLSGGEQTMLAVARAMCIEPAIMMLDEPTEGLMPSAIAGIRDAVIKLRDSGVGILLVEQRVDAVLPVADRVAFMDHGQIKAEFGIEEVRNDLSLLHHFVGVSDTSADGTPKRPTPTPTAASKPAPKSAKTPAPKQDTPNTPDIAPKPAARTPPKTATQDHSQQVREAAMSSKPIKGLAPDR